FGIHPDRAYESYAALLEREAALPADERIQFVSIATPNHLHFPIAQASLQAGFHVVCDKPMTVSLTDAERMVRTVQETGRVFALTHNYSGYPMVRQARDMIASGELGDLIAVRVTYVQGWMHGMKPGDTPARGAWKADPGRNGRAGSLGDVGTHAFHLLRFMTGLQPESLLSRMSSYSKHHELDDYGHALIRFHTPAAGSPATGLVTWSQVTHGRLNDLAIEIDGTKAAVTWRQEEPNQLFVRSLGQPTRVYDRNPNAGYSTPAATASCRLPGGHPEAFFEAFANVYRDAFTEMRRRNSGEPSNPQPVFPTVHDGHDGVRFMTRCLESADQNSAWQSW
ncbi:MAG: Gfo/Idh/MocA family oxidoreductase, partial [Planctomycetaceae bacterium]|nr:Gfo/Idh/MocA family oxidoreductase [Planctomycetaceae bacterium]